MSLSVIKWSDLPGELVNEVAGRVFSKVELLRVRSICKPWRSAASIHKRFPKRHDRNRVRVLSPLISKGTPCLLSPAAFFRVFPSSCRNNKGWLIKTQDVSEETRKRLLCPLSRVPIKSPRKTLDLLKYTVTEIHQSYEVHKYFVNPAKSESCNFARVVLLNNLVFGVNDKKEIWWCNNDNNNKVWTRVSDVEVKHFSDIIVHRGQLYALDHLNGATWWISLSEFKIFQYGPPTPMDYYDFDDCKEKRLIEFGGDLCIIHRFCFCKKVRVGGRDNVERTIDFKVYKMDMELVEWVEVKSLGGNAFVMATDSCFSVVASDYHGCLEDAIYFYEDNYVESVNVFKLGDGSVTKMVKSSSSKSCFDMFYPPFV